MILIPCPHCGPRNSNEFAYFGETTLTARRERRPISQEWSDYLYMKRNPAGWTTEHWYHRKGAGNSSSQNATR